MSCENATLSLLLQRGDITVIAVLVAVGVGSFLLGILATIAVRILCRPSPTSRLVDSKQDTDSHSVSERISNGIHDGILLPPRSLSQTFVRHSLKPPMNMFSTKEKIEWSSQSIPFHDRQNSDNPFGSIGQESRSYFASEGTPRFDRVELVDDHHVHAYNPRIFDARCHRDFAKRQSFSCSTTESTICETGSTPDLLVTTTRFIGEKAEALGYPSQDPARPERNSIQRAKSDPRIAHSGREKTEYKLSAHELRRMKTFSPPEHDSDSCGDRNAPVMEMQARERSRRPRLTTTHLSETTMDPSSSPGTALRKGKESDLTRQNSQRAVVFYQEHANRHLNLPLGGPLRSSTVLPDSPSGVIGDFSLA